MLEKEYFLFPFKFDDLKKRNPQNKEAYVVDEKNFKLNGDMGKLLSALQKIEQNFLKSWEQIMRHENFDFLFLTIGHIQSCPDSNGKLLAEILQIVSEILTSTLEAILEETPRLRMEFTGIQEREGRVRNALKMTVFLVCYFTEAVTCQETKALSQFLQEKESQRKRTKSAIHGMEYLEKCHMKCLVILKQLLELSFSFLWPNSIIENDFLRAIVSAGLKAFESPSLCKNEKAAQIVFFIVEKNIENQGFSKEISERLRHLVFEYERSIEPVIFLLAKAYQTDKVLMVQLANEAVSIFFEALLDKTGSAAESQAVKNAKEFLSRLAHKIPKLFLNKFSSVLELYASDSYSIRSTASEVLTQIILQLLRDDPALDAETQKMHLKAKIRHIEVLAERFLDKSAFVRSHALGNLIQICTSNCLPRELLVPVLQKTLGRTRDQAVFVRKKALQLTCELVKLYSGNPSEPRDHLKGSLSMDSITKQIETLDKETSQINEQIRVITETMNRFSEESEEFLLCYAQWNQMEERKKKLEDLRGFVMVSYRMLETILSFIPDLKMLLNSRCSSDVTESIQVFLLLKLLGVEDAEIGMRKMLGQVWSTDAAVRDAVVQAYFEAYFRPNAFSQEQIGSNLVNIFITAENKQLPWIERLVSQVVYSEDEEKMMIEKGEDSKTKGPAPLFIDKRVFVRLWEVFFGHILEGSESNSQKMDIFAQNKPKTRAILRLIRVVAEKDIRILIDRIKDTLSLLKSYLTEELPVDWIIVKEIACIAGLLKTQKMDGVEGMLKFLLFILVKFHGTTENEWFLACEEYVRLIFKVKKFPEKSLYGFLSSCTNFLYLEELKRSNEMKIEESKDERGAMSKTSASKRRNEQNVPLDLELPQGIQASISASAIKTLDSIEEEKGPRNKSQEEEFEQKLAQLIFLIGQVVLGLFLHFENIENELQKKRNDQERLMKLEISETSEELNQISADLDAELEMKRESLHSILETRLFSSEENLLGSFFPLIKAICTRSMLRGFTINEILERASVLTFTKYMLACSALCSEENMQVILGILESNVDSCIKANLIIAMGDFNKRFPIFIEPYNHFLYRNLTDSESIVRKTTLLVLTHLILSDMVKIKGEICEFAQLLSDPDIKIQKIVKGFFAELGKKDPKIIYNLLPEAISRMAKEKMPEELFQDLARILIQFLEKEKYSESLVDKLCTRFKTSNDLSELRNTSFCLPLLFYNEKAAKKLLEHFENYRDKLTDSEISKNFHGALTKIKKSHGKIDKKDVDELENCLLNFAEIHIERIRRAPNKKKNEEKENFGANALKKSEIKRKPLRIIQKNEIRGQREFKMDSIMGEENSKRKKTSKMILEKDGSGSEDLSESFD